jgi:uncharacterized membrane protein (GlpM family)
MHEILIRFLIGGFVVSAFAVFGDLFKPKSLAGLFGAAPSVALATLGLTVATEGSHYAAAEARSMLAGAVALFSYACAVNCLIRRYRLGATAVTVCAIPVWAGLAFAFWHRWLR